MRIVCITGSGIFFIIFLAISVTMYGNSINSTVDGLMDLPAVVYAILLGILAFLSGFMFSQAKIEQVKSEASKQVRKAEKAGIDSKESLDKINRLNSKIETLEIALQEALKNKSKN